MSAGLLLFPAAWWKHTENTSEFVFFFIELEQNISQTCAVVAPLYKANILVLVVNVCWIPALPGLKGLLNVYYKSTLGSCTLVK